MTTITATSFPRMQVSRLPWITITLVSIILLAGVLRFAQLANIGDGNAYYTAAVKAMLQSPSNFFFAAAEPGGSVTVDKPPLGLWIQAVFGLIFGVYGWSVALPQVIAGILCVPLLYHLVRRPFGPLAGLIAALILAITPVSVAVDANNTMDTLLILTLLCAAWTFIRAVDTGKVGYLYLGAALVGAGFNIKMMQAFLPLPAFYALYFFAANHPWRKKIVQLAAASVILAVVSFSWAVIVDLTPADQRPYVGSSTTNSVFELIFGYNGVGRLTGTGTPSGGMGMSLPLNGNPGDADGQQGQLQPPAGFNPPQGLMGAGPGGMGEIGEPGVLRLFTAPLVKELGWLLPLGFLSIILLIFSGLPQFPLNESHKAVILWGGWLVTGVVFFSVARFFHAYYLAMLAAPLAALIGSGVWAWWKQVQANRFLAALMLIFAAAVTILFQSAALMSFNISTEWLTAVASVALVMAAVLIAASLRSRRLYQLASIVLVATMLVVPMYVSYQTASAESPNVTLPAASLNNNESGLLMGRMLGGGRPELSVANSKLISYLQAKTEGQKWMLAVPSAMLGSQTVLETGRGVLFMGGFSGNDPVVTPQSLAEIVARGELSYVLYGGGMFGNQDAGIDAWLKANCTTVEASLWQDDQASRPIFLGGMGMNMPDMQIALWECR
ncbi:MAG: glycosyltransferase family 39 protein [Anaerolineae bacterium]